MCGKKKSNGRRRNVTCQDERRTCRTASNSTSTLRLIHADLELAVSHTTVWRAIHRNGHIQHAALTKAPRIEEHQRARLNFAQENMETDLGKVNNSSNFFENNAKGGKLFGYCSSCVVDEKI
ncbi:hypothetical protein ANCCEY_06927 [Ancylostoma ceylanicum]|uniref:Transposable element Tc3 transposase-like DNA-binding HTH domain-containing protein n=1 Tax=Ancylostoma ceylanicum TaxID=53326 RepID=A0A0D6LPH8_9BILA|nr:hypothetical protein ANCCEY_06927 [Ancylostoma ceylanicum]